MENNIDIIKVSFNCGKSTATLKANGLYNLSVSDFSKAIKYIANDDNINNAINNLSAMFEFLSNCKKENAAVFNSLEKKIDSLHYEIIVCGMYKQSYHADYSVYAAIPGMDNIKICDYAPEKKQETVKNKRRSVKKKTTKTSPETVKTDPETVKTDPEIMTDPETVNGNNAAVLTVTINNGMAKTDTIPGTINDVSVIQETEKQKNQSNENPMTEFTHVYHIGDKLLNPETGSVLTVKYNGNDGYHFCYDEKNDTIYSECTYKNHSSINVLVPVIETENITVYESKPEIMTDPEKMTDPETGNNEYEQKQISGAVSISKSVPVSSVMFVSSITPVSCATRNNNIVLNAATNTDNTAAYEYITGSVIDRTAHDAIDNDFNDSS